MKRIRRPSKRQRQAEIILNVARQIREDHGEVTPMGLANHCNQAGVAVGLPEAEAVCKHVNRKSP